MCIFRVFPGLFNRVDIEQVRFSYTCTKSTKQQIESSLTVDNDNVCKGEKRTRVRNVTTIWFIYHDFQGPSPNSKTFPGLENLNLKFHDFPGSVCTMQTAFVQNSF